jgi:hypothetical protein
MPRATRICIGEAKLVYRKWLQHFAGRRVGDRFRQAQFIGHWTYWAVMSALGHERRMMISKSFYNVLVERGVKRGKDIVDRKFKPLPPKDDK